MTYGQQAVLYPRTFYELLGLNDSNNLKCISYYLETVQGLSFPEILKLTTEGIFWFAFLLAVK